MNSHELLTQVEATVSVLRALWTEIGTTEDKRAATLEQLRASFAALCDDAISRHQGVRDELAQRVDSYQRAIDRIQRELHSERDALPHHDDSPLLQRSEKLMLQLSMLQKVRAERVDTITDLHEQLRQLWLELGADMTQLPYTQAPQHLIRRFSCAAFDMNTVSAQVDMDDLSSDRVARYEHLIAEALALKNQRQQQITKLCDDISTLSRELGVQAEDDDDEDADADEEAYDASVPLADDSGINDASDTFDEEELLQAPARRVSSITSIDQQLNLLDIDDDDSAAFASFASNTTNVAPAVTVAHSNNHMATADVDDVDDDEDDDDSVALFSLAMIEDLSNKLAQLQEEKRQRVEHIDYHKTEIASLWARLKLPADETDAFLREHNGLTVADVEAYSAELQRLRELKQVRGRELIEEQRTELRTIILNTMAAGGNTDGGVVSQTENDAAIMRSILGDFYEAYTSTEYDDRLLALHEDEVAKQRQLQQDMKPLLDSIDNRKQLLALKAKIDECSRDPSRLQARTHGASERLQQELRDKKHVSKLPDFEKTLLKQLEDWESRTGRPFLYEGQRYIDVIRAYQQAELKKRELEKRLKEEAKKRPQAVIESKPAAATAIPKKASKTAKPATTTTSTTTPRVTKPTGATTKATSASARVVRPPSSMQPTRGIAAPMTPMQPTRAKAATTPLRPCNATSTTSHVDQATVAALEAATKLFADFSNSPQLSRKLRPTTGLDAENTGGIPRRKLRMTTLQK